VGDVVGEDGVAFCASLVASHGVAVAPGDTFGPGGRGALRVSLAASDETIVAGLRRVATALR
jgi:aspartate/methionine/tyrosine aminotransferase